METSSHPQRRRILSVAVVGLAAVALTACTGRGGGQLPPDGIHFAGPASFGFDFSCADNGGLNPPTGQLRIELSYADHGRSPIGSPFSVHGTVDELDPALESAICIGQNAPPGGNELIFLGRYRLTSSAPEGLPSTCARSGDQTATSCRFEVVLRDNDMDRAPSAGDYFQITLSSATAATSVLDPATVFYARAGVLSSGNLTVD